MKRLIIMIFCIICLANTCEKQPFGVEVYSFFWIKNNSSGNISYLISQLYPDTLIPDTKESLLMLNPEGQKQYTQSKKMEDFFSELPMDILSVFFFSNDTLTKYGFEKVRSNYNILKRKDISLADLNSNNNIVAYP